jgi:apolipoprotein D and lipocalin family protein
MKKISLISLLFLGICCCSSPRELATVIKVDINKYAGRWYEIARLPNSFEKGLECITAVYKELIKTAKQRGFDTEKMIIVKHDCK